MKYANRRIRIPYKETWIEADVVALPPNSLDLDKPFQCPHCRKFLHIALESEEHTRFYDKFTLFLVCPRCRSAWLHNSVYEASYEPVLPAVIEEAREEARKNQ